jgi:O-antigen/teichoic acid export membrane protein
LCVGAGSQLFLVPLYLSYWTPREYGVWIGIGAIGSLIQFLDVGHHNYIGSEALRRGSQSRDELSTLYGSAVRAALIASVIELAVVVALVRGGAVGALLGGHTVGDPLLRDAGFILVVQSAFWLLQGNWSAVAGRVLLPFGYFPQIGWFQALVPIATIVVQVVALALGAKLLVTGVAYHLTYALCSWVGVSYLRRMIVRERLNRDRSYVVGILNYRRSLVLSVKGVLDMLRQEQFRIVIAPLVSPAALVLFITTRTLANVFVAGLGTITNPLTPELARFLSLRDATRSTSVVTVVWLVLVGVLAPAAVAAPVLIQPFFVTWTRGRIQFDAVLLALFLAGVLLFAFAQPAICVLQSLNRATLQMAVSAVATTAALTGTFIFVPAIGVKGAAGSLLAGELIVCVCTVAALRRTFGSLGMAWPQKQVLITASSLAASCLLIVLGSRPGASASFIIPGGVVIAVVGSAALLASLPDSTRLMGRTVAKLSVQALRPSMKAPYPTSPLLDLDRDRRL